jgi:hypothetical protein
MMRNRCWLVASSLGLLFAGWAHALQVSRLTPRAVVVETTNTKSQSRRWQPLSAGSDDEPSSKYSKPLTAFGAEIVPEGQRPVNEYLDMRRAPLFDWASEETGTVGVSSRNSKSLVYW